MNGSRERIGEYGCMVSRRSYVLGVFALAVVGTAIPLVVLAALIGIGLYELFIHHLTIGALKLVILFGIPLWVLLKSLFRSGEVPSGIAIDESSAPDLHRAIEAIRRQANAGPVSHVLIDSDFNCSIVQRPKFGIVGAFENYLVLGLPLLLSLTPEQFRGVLAHEFGHISRNHGRISSYVYVVRRAWATMLESLAQSSGIGRFVLFPYYRWFIPFFDRVSYRVAREQELEADAIAARVSDAQTFADALVAINVRGPATDRQFSSILESAHDSPEPPTDVFMQMASFAMKPLRDGAEFYLRVPQTADSFDTHPPIPERIRAVGASAEVALQNACHELPKTAAREYLGPSCDALLRQFSDLWARGVRSVWNQLHSSAMEKRNQLRSLEEAAMSGTLNDRQMENFAILSLQVQDPERERRLMSALERMPQNIDLQFALGSFLVETDRQAEGIAYLRSAAASQFQYRVAANRVLLELEEKSGNFAAADSIRQEYLSMIAAAFESGQHGVKLEPGMKFEPPVLGPTAYEEIRHIARQTPYVKQAFLARAVVPQIGITHVLFIAREQGRNLVDDATFIRDFNKDDRISQHVFTFVIPKNEETAFYDALSRIPNARL